MAVNDAKQKRPMGNFTNESKPYRGVYDFSEDGGVQDDEYVLLEAEDRDSAEEAVFNLPYVKGIIGKTIGYEEIKNMVEPTASTISIKRFSEN